MIEEESIFYLNGISWVTNDLANKCFCCKVRFSTLVRKHHCRRCGNIICTKCSKNKSKILRLLCIEPVKICMFCFCSVKNENEFIENQIPILTRGCIITLKFLGISEVGVHLEPLNHRHLIFENDGKLSIKSIESYQKITNGIKLHVEDSKEIIISIPNDYKSRSNSNNWLEAFIMALEILCIKLNI